MGKLERLRAGEHGGRSSGALPWDGLGLALGVDVGPPFSEAPQQIVDRVPCNASPRKGRGSAWPKFSITYNALTQGNTFFMSSQAKGASGIFVRTPAKSGCEGAECLDWNPDSGELYTLVVDLIAEALEVADQYFNDHLGQGKTIVFGGGPLDPQPERRRVPVRELRAGACDPPREVR